MKKPEAKSNTSTDLFDSYLDVAEPRLCTPQPFMKSFPYIDMHQNEEDIQSLSINRLEMKGAIN